MEGQEGFMPNADSEQMKIQLKKLFFIGLIISSNFVIHCNYRPDIITIELLKDMYDTLNKTKDKLGVEPP